MYQATGVKCPICGGDIMESARAYGCRNWRPEDGGCNVTIWKDSYGHAVTREEAAQMFDGQVVGPFDLTFKSGNTTNASLYYDSAERKVRVKFPPRNNEG